MTQPGIPDHRRAMRSRKNRMAFGCLGFPLAAGVAALWAAVHLMGKWEALDGAVRVAGIALAVIGTILLLPPTLVIASIGPRLLHLKSRSANPVSSTRRTVEEMKQLYVNRHEYRPATDADFTNRDRSWYEATTRESQALGYRCLGDRVNLTVEQTSGVVAISRRFLSADLTVRRIAERKFPNSPQAVERAVARFDAARVDERKKSGTDLIEGSDPSL